MALTVKPGRIPHRTTALYAARVGPWKLHFKEGTPSTGDMRGLQRPSEPVALALLLETLYI